MRSGRWPHVLALAAVAALPVHAQPQPAPDLPDWQAGPAVFAVTPFENHVPNGKSFEWIVAGAPFEIAEKTETVLGLDPAGGALYVPGQQVPAEPDTVADFAARQRATYVVTGWYDRVGEDLRIDTIVWKVDRNGGAKVAGEAQKQGAMPTYHAILGEAMADAWTKAGVAIDLARRERLSRALSKDIYPVFMMGRGIGLLTGAITQPGGTPDLKNAEHDLERAVFLDPKLYEAQRLLGELYMRTAPADPKAIARAGAKFNYAADLAPDDIASLRAAATATAAAGKWEPALEMFTKLVAHRPWDLEARFQLGQAMWQLGNAKAAERQLEQVTAHAPNHLAARRVLVLIHSSRGDTKRLVTELEAIAARAPDDLEVKSDLASAYGALKEWPKAIAALEQVAAARPSDLALLVRVGDAHRKHGDLDAALGWYQRAARLAPESSMPGFVIAQAELDAGRLAEANRTYTNLQKYVADNAAAQQALGVIALAQHRPDDAAWYLRRAVRAAPRVLATRRAAAAAELARKDPASALAQLEPALAGWPDDGVLHYLAGIAHHMAGDNTAAHTDLQAALAVNFTPARAALNAIDAGGTATMDWTPEPVRPWGDGDAVAAELDRFAMLRSEIATARAAFQDHFVTLLGVLGKGPAAKVKPGSVTTCPVTLIAPGWAQSQQLLVHAERLGVELEASYRFIARHDELGLTAGLLPNQRLAVAAAKHDMRLALEDAAELRAEWARGLAPELRVAGCSDRLLAAAVADPSRYQVIEEDRPEPIPTQSTPRPKPRSTFFVDNTRCADAVDVYIDGKQIGQVAPHRRSALIADGGERSLCLLGPGAVQCGDRGTVRQVYLHDGWSVTMHCPK